MDGNVMLKRMLNKQGRRVLLTLYGSGQHPAAGSCQQNNELSGSIKGNELSDQLATTSSMESPS
jgi:3-hydroxy-3-methylglutaryl CoA synthase